jgi:hypothetical protein
MLKSIYFPEFRQHLNCVAVKHLRLMTGLLLAVSLNITDIRSITDRRLNVAEDEKRVPPVRLPGRISYCSRNLIHYIDASGWKCY